VGQAIGFRRLPSGLRPNALPQVKQLEHWKAPHPCGDQAFERETGIKESDWFPDLWLRWGDALEEAGFTRNIFTTKALSNEFLAEHYARLAQRLGHLPIRGELIRESKADAAFPVFIPVKRLFVLTPEAKGLEGDFLDIAEDSPIPRRGSGRRWWT
jgi:hypothetical protein